jgi:hypothetical protein
MKASGMLSEQICLQIGCACTRQLYVCVRAPMSTSMALKRSAPAQSRAAGQAPALRRRPHPMCCVQVAMPLCPQGREGQAPGSALVPLRLQGLPKQQEGEARARLRPQQAPRARPAEAAWAPCSFTWLPRSSKNAPSSLQRPPTASPGPQPPIEQSRSVLLWQKAAAAPAPAAGGATVVPRGAFGGSCLMVTPASCRCPPPSQAQRACLWRSHSQGEPCPAGDNCPYAHQLFGGFRPQAGPRAGTEEARRLHGGPPSARLQEEPMACTRLHAGRGLRQACACACDAGRDAHPPAAATPCRVLAAPDALPDVPMPERPRLRPAPLLLCAWPRRAA